MSIYTAREHNVRKLVVTVAVQSQQLVWKSIVSLDFPFDGRPRNHRLLSRTYHDVRVPRDSAWILCLPIACPCISTLKIIRAFVKPFL